MSKKSLEPIVIDRPITKRNKNILPIASRESTREYVPRPAINIGELLCRQQMQGVESCTSHTIPTQADDSFGTPGILGNICADRHMLLQDYLDSCSTSNTTTDNTPS